MDWVIECKAKLVELFMNSDNQHIDELIKYFDEGASWNEYVLGDNDTELLIKCLELVKMLKRVTIEIRR